MESFGLILNLFILVFLLGLGYFFGSYRERQHYRSIEARERETLSMALVTARSWVTGDNEVRDARLVHGSAVISVDYFKRILAGLRNIFGGRIAAYESLIDRARREATLRMKVEAGNADMIINVRIETSTIGNAAQQTTGSIEAFAYGTAITLAAKNEG